MIVVDTNIIAYIYLDEKKYSQKAELLFKMDPIWAAPILWRSEFRSILTLYCRQKIINYENCSEIMLDAEQFLKNNEYEVSSSLVFELAHQSSCSAYDCEFVALAKKLHIPLITEDKKILKEFPQYANSLDSYLESNVIFEN